MVSASRAPQKHPTTAPTSSALQPAPGLVQAVWFGGPPEKVLGLVLKNLKAHGIEVFAFQDFKVGQKLTVPAAADLLLLNKDCIHDDYATIVRQYADRHGLQVAWVRTDWAPTYTALVSQRVLSPSPTPTPVPTPQPPRSTPTLVSGPTTTKATPTELAEADALIQSAFPATAAPLPAPPASHPSATASLAAVSALLALDEPTLAALPRAVRDSLLAARKAHVAHTRVQPVVEQVTGLCDDDLCSFAEALPRELVERLQVALASRG